MADTEKNTSITPRKTEKLPRGRFGLLKFSRRSDKTWQFSGQQPGEEVRMVVRKHWWFLFVKALPFVGAVLVLLIFLPVLVLVHVFTTLWLLIEISAFLALIVTGIWFAYNHLIPWWYETYIITNKRIINARGLLEPTRQQTPIEKVQQLGVDIKSLRGLLLGYGTIHVYLTGGDFYIKDIPRPNSVRDAIQGVTDIVKAGKPKEDALPVPKSAQMAAVIDALAKEKPVAQLPDADADLPPARSIRTVRGPRRTFGGPLRIACNVRYLSGEYTVKYIQRSRYVLWRNLALPTICLIFALPLAFVAPVVGWVPLTSQFWWFFMGLVILGILGWAGFMYGNFVDDVYILTNRRIIDIDRFFIFLSERHLETEYKNIRDIRVKIPSVMQRFLDIGDVYVETPGSSPDIILSNVDNPFVLQDEILGIKTHKDREDAAKKENTEKKNLQKWFTLVVTKLEDTALGRGTPNLRDMDLLSAMTCAQEYGLDLTVQGEAVGHSYLPPGHVVKQSPPPGTVMEKGSRIEVVLSRGAGAVTQQL